MEVPDLLVGDIGAFFSPMGLAEELLVAAHDGKGRAGVGFQLT